MNWEQQTETLRVLQSYAASALVAMLTVYWLSLLVHWLLKWRDPASDQGKSGRE